jgi:cobalt/nickel transport system permease protein
MIPFMLYPAIIFSITQIPVLPILKRALVVLPLVLGIGIVNLIVDKSSIDFGGLLISGGLLSLISLFIRYGLTVTAALLMIATTGIVKLSYAMRMMKIPKLLVLQVSLTYRYISVLFEEVAQTTLAYRLRAYGYKGVRVREWGPLTGQILLRTFDRAQSVYRAMRMRGFNGDYHPGGNIKLSYKDAAYFFVWVLIFVATRAFDITQLLGSAIS